jgi:hypothetical protein
MPTSADNLCTVCSLTQLRELELQASFVPNAAGISDIADVLRVIGNLQVLMLIVGWPFDMHLLISIAGALCLRLCHLHLNMVYCLAL